MSKQLSKRTTGLEPATFGLGSQQTSASSSFRHRIIREYEVWHPDHVVQREDDVSARHVRNIRNEAGGAPLTGEPKDDADAAALEPDRDAS